MTSSARPNRINIDLQSYKQPWLDYCKAHGTNPSEAFRQIVAKLTGGGGTGKTLPAAETERPAKVRCEIRVRKTELARAEAIARREGFSLTRWIVSLINARLDATFKLGQPELEALARSNLQMLAIGRNLNQPARAANNGIHIGAAGGNVIEGLRTAVLRHVSQVAGVLTANTARWRH